MDKTSFSIIMIVKNEEKRLPACLDSIQNLADEMVIVDTGSTDRTLSIAAEKGAVVVREAWQDDFSKARQEVDFDRAAMKTLVQSRPSM